MAAPDLRPLPNHYSLEPRTRQRFAGADLGTLQTTVRHHLSFNWLYLFVTLSSQICANV